jgi:hypothetical protein
MDPASLVGRRKKDTMAQQVRVDLADDIDGIEAAQTTPSTSMA